ncbi:unnamed protein product, partial [marine sediment metagenome]
FSPHLFRGVGSDAVSGKCPGVKRMPVYGEEAIL